LRFRVFPGGGLFYSLNLVIDSSLATGETPMPDWRNSLYSLQGEDAWDYAFQRAGHSAEDAHEDTAVCLRYLPEPEQGDPRIGPRGRQVPEEFRFGPTTTLAPPANRKYINGVIHSVAKLKTNFQDDFSERARQLDMQNSICVHARGPGRTHGGVAWFCHLLNRPNPPLDLYVKKTLELAEKNNLNRAVVFSDADVTRKELVQRLQSEGLEAFSPAAQLEPFGEGHIESRISGYTQMMEALSDAYLMAAGGGYIHGCSNLSNFVLCANPDLPSIDIFEGYY
jgi:hypothetical protein